MACNRCDRFIKSSSITASSSDVIITISSAPTLTNLKRFCLVLAQNLPEGANTLPVQISDWLAEKAVENFKNVDGTEGAHWTIEQIDDVSEGKAYRYYMQVAKA